MENVLSEYLDCCEFHYFNELLFSCIDKSGLKDFEIYKNVDIDRKLFSKIRCNSNYIPKKNTILKFCISLKLNEEDSNKLLKAASYSLSNTKFDLIIAFCLRNSIYNLDIINDYLFTFTNATL